MYIVIRVTTVKFLNFIAYFSFHQSKFPKREQEKKGQKGTEQGLWLGCVEHELLTYLVRNFRCLNEVYFFIPTDFFYFFGVGSGCRNRFAFLCGTGLGATRDLYTENDEFAATRRLEFYSRRTLYSLCPNFAYRRYRCFFACAYQCRSFYEGCGMTRS